MYVHSSPNQEVDDADNVVLIDGASALVQAADVLERVSSSVGSLDAVVCAAGGWAGGSIRDGDALANITKMHAMNTESAVLGACGVHPVVWQ